MQTWEFKNIVLLESTGNHYKSKWQERMKKTAEQKTNSMLQVVASHSYKDTTLRANGFSYGELLAGYKEFPGI